MGRAQRKELTGFDAVLGGRRGSGKPPDTRIFPAPLQYIENHPYVVDDEAAWLGPDFSTMTFAPPKGHIVAIKDTALETELFQWEEDDVRAFRKHTKNLKPPFYGPVTRMPEPYLMKLKNSKVVLVISADDAATVEITNKEGETASFSFSVSSLDLQEAPEDGEFYQTRLGSLPEALEKDATVYKISDLEETSFKDIFETIIGFENPDDQGLVAEVIKNELLGKKYVIEYAAVSSGRDVHIVTDKEGREIEVTTPDGLVEIAFHCGDPNDAFHAGDPSGGHSYFLEASDLKASPVEWETEVGGYPDPQH